MVRQRIRLHFSKKGNLRFIGHRDLITTMERLFRRARLPLAMSQGFHPKPKISYLSALPLGYAGEDELVEIVMEEYWSSEALLTALNTDGIAGLLFHRAELLSEDAGKMKALAFDYLVAIPDPMRTSTRQAIDALMARESATAVKPNGKEVEVRRFVRRLALDDGSLRLTLDVGNGPEATVREVLVCLGMENELFRSLFPVRLGAILDSDKRGSLPT